MITGRYGTFANRADYVRAWRKANWSRLKDSSNKQARSWAISNPEKRKQIMRSWRAKNRSRIRTYYRNRRHNNPQVAMAVRLRTRIASVLRRKRLRKCNTTVLLLGIDLDGLRRHIESLFLPGMTWENRRLWHIDHIRPCASFDLTDPVQQHQCFHYSNLQPLWWKDNLSKADKTT